jgi:hypothetical protein
MLLDVTIQTRAEIISFLNLALFGTAVISIKQFFWPGDNNTLPFQVFNMVFAILFYSISLPFLITNRMYYEQYEQLVPLSVISKFFLSANISSFGQWVIIASIFINVLYIIKYRRDYFQAGIATTQTSAQAIMQESIVEHNEEVRAQIAEEQQAKEEVLPYKSSELNDEEIEEIEKAAETTENDITQTNP